MTSLFFEEPDQSYSKCIKCPLYKDARKSIKKVQESGVYIKRELRTSQDYHHVANDNIILFVLDNTYTDIPITEYRKYIEQWGFRKYDILEDIRCTVQSKFPYSINSTVVATCNITKTINLTKYKAIITFGDMFKQFVATKKTINTWLDFSEHLFNPIFFYSSTNKIRVYPLPPTSDMIGFTYYMQHGHRVYKSIEKFINTGRGIEHPFITQPIDAKPVGISIDEYMQQHKDVKSVAVDLETSSLDMFDDKFFIVSISLSVDGLTGGTWDWDGIDKDKLNTFLANKLQIYAYGKFDVKILQLQGIQNACIGDDITISYRVLSTQRTTSSLKALAYLIGHGGYDKPLEDYKETHKIDSYADIPKHILYPYATLDVVLTYRLYQYSKMLFTRQPEVYKNYKETLLPVTNVFVMIEIEGMCIDRDKIQSLLTKYDTILTDVQKRLVDMTFDGFNPLSNISVEKALHKLNVTKLLYTDKKNPKTDANSLHTLIKLNATNNQAVQFMELLLEYKKIKPLKSFIQSGDVAKGKDTGLMSHIKNDGKIHASFFPGMTTSGRSTSANPNLQNQPKHSSEAKAFRELFSTPSKDYKFMEVDYDGMQLRIACILSGDKRMMDVFTSTTPDLHSLTAVGIFHRGMSLKEFIQKKDEKPYKVSRQKSKGINFAFLFGQTWRSFSNITISKEWTIDESIAYIMKSDAIKDAYIIEDDMGTDTYYRTFKKLKDIVGKHMGKKILTDKEKKVVFDCVAYLIQRAFFRTYSMYKEWTHSIIGSAYKRGYVENLIGGRRHLPFMLGLNDSTKGKEVSNWRNISSNSPIQHLEALTIYKAMIGIYKEMTQLKLKSRMVAMVHDSIVFYCYKDEKDVIISILDKYMKGGDYSVPFSYDYTLSDVWGFCG